MKTTAIGRTWMGSHYDVLAAFASACLLFVSAWYLVARLHYPHLPGGSFAPSLGPPAPGRAGVSPIDSDTYEALLRELRSPAERPGPQRPLFSTTPRLPCAQCGQPLHLAAVEERLPCPACGTVPPLPPPDADSDGDGMPDVWEIAHGLDRRDRADAALDPDGDGFTNREEYASGTDPADGDHSPLLTQFRLVNLRAQPFPLHFAGLTELPGGSFRFAVNDTRGVSHFLALGDGVENCTLEAYQSDPPAIALRRGDDRIVLDLGRIHYDYVAELLFLLDGRRFRVKADDLFKIRDRTYEIPALDPHQLTLREVPGGKEWVIELARAPTGPSSAE